MARLPLLMRQVSTLVRSRGVAYLVKRLLWILVIAGLLSFVAALLFRDVLAAGYFTGLVLVVFLLFISVLEFFYSALNDRRTVYRFPYARFRMYYGSVILLGCILLLASISEATLFTVMIKSVSAFTVWIVAVLSMAYDLVSIFGKDRSEWLPKRVYAIWVALFILTIIAPVGTGVFISLSLLAMAFTVFSIIRKIKTNTEGLLLLACVGGACAAVGTVLMLQTLPDFLREWSYTSDLSIGGRNVSEFVSEMREVSVWLAIAAFMIPIAPVGIILLERLHVPLIISFWKAWVSCFISIMFWIAGVSLSEATNGASLAIGGVIFTTGIALSLGFAVSVGRSSSNPIISNIGGWFAKSHIRNAHIGAFIGLYLFFLRPSLYAAIGDAAWSKWYIGASPVTDLLNYWRLRNDQSSFLQYWIPLPNPFLVDWLILILFLMYVAFKLYRFFSARAREDLSKSNLLSKEALTRHELHAKVIPEPQMLEQVDAQRDFLDECLPNALLTETVTALSNALWPQESIISAVRPILTYKDRGMLPSLFRRRTENDRLSALKRFKEEVTTSPIGKEATPLSIKGRLVDRSLDDFVSGGDKAGLVVLCALYDLVKGFITHGSIYYELIRYKESRTILNLIPGIGDIFDIRERKKRENLGKRAVKQYNEFTI